MSDRIKFGEVREERLPERELPISLLDRQQPPPGSFVVLLDRQAHQRIHAHAKRHTDSRDRRRSVECAGLLAGQAFYDSERRITFVAIRDAVETPAESQSAGSVRIAPQDFQQSRESIDRMQLRVVGWYHTHPDYGIFLSQDDRTVVQSLFNASYHVALVYDPIRKQLGCFFGPQSNRVDTNSDRDIAVKRNYAVVSDWLDFWHEEDGGGCNRLLEDNDTGITLFPEGGDIVPGLPDNAPEGLTVPVDPQVDVALTQPSKDIKRPQRRRMEKRRRERLVLFDYLLYGLSGLGVIVLVLVVGIWIGRSNLQPAAALPMQQIGAASNTTAEQPRQHATTQLTVQPPEAERPGVQPTRGATVPSTMEPQTAQTAADMAVRTTPQLIQPTPAPAPAGAPQATLNAATGQTLCSVEKVSNPKTTPGHSINITVLDAQGAAKANTITGIWSKNPQFPAYSRGNYWCTTNAEGRCVIENLTVELPDVYIGLRDSACEALYGALPGEPQDIRITLKSVM